MRANNSAALTVTDIIHTDFFFYWASGWEWCWKAGYSIAVSRSHDVPLKCVQVWNWGWINIPELEWQRETAQTQQRGPPSHLTRLEMVWDEVKNMPNMNVNLWSRHTQHGNTSGFYFLLYKLFAWHIPVHLNTHPISAFLFFGSSELSVFSRSRNQEVRRGCTKPPQFKRLPPLFLRHANREILRGLILAYLYAFVPSKCMCVFSPLFSLLCVADSSQDLTESSYRRAACQALPLTYPLFSSHRTHRNYYIHCYWLDYLGPQKGYPPR